MTANRILRVIALALMALAVFEVGTKAQEQFWFNLPDSPLKIERSPNGRFITLGNYSFKESSKYRLGCVVTTDERIKVVSKFSEEIDSIAPFDSVNDQYSATLLDLTQEDVKKCTNKGAKLAAVEVVFADGSTWKIDEQFYARSLSRLTPKR